jgi:Phosphotransferase enzyme family
MIILDAENVFSYLIATKIIRKEECINCQVLPLDGKNFSLAVYLNSDRALIVKQAPIGSDETDPFLGEWLVGELIQKFAAFSDWQQHCAVPTHYDIPNQVIVAPFLTGHQNLLQFYQATPTFPSAVAAAVGQTLARLHRLSFDQLAYCDVLGDADADLVDESLPSNWDILPLPTPADFSEWRSDGWQFLRLYQRNPALESAIGELEQHWQPRCLTHQDLRLDNWLVADDPLAKIRLIDWECLQWGDPLADLGNLLAAYLLCWLNSLEPIAHLPIGLVLQTATVPLSLLQPSLVALLDGYVTEFPVIQHLTPDWQVALAQFTGRSLLERIQLHLRYYQPFDRQQRIIFEIAQQLLCQPIASLNEILGQPYVSSNTLASPHPTHPRLGQKPMDHAIPSPQTTAPTN